jgi:hypothetical protein
LRKDDTIKMALDLLPKSMFEAIDLLPDASTPVTLFTRHSLRELVDGQGLAGYDLQLTPQGRELAQEWGNYLIKNTDRVIQHCISSPIQRCVDTAALMIEGADDVSPNQILIRLKLLSKGYLLNQVALCWIYNKLRLILKSRVLWFY